MNKRALDFAYTHYLKTGDVFGMWEGAVRRGNGPPVPAMVYEQFEKAVRAIPKPPPRPEKSHQWPTEAERARCASIWEHAKSTMPQPSMDKPRQPFPDLSRHAFRDFQRRNPDIHGNPLSYVSRRMTGEHNE